MAVGLTHLRKAAGPQEEQQDPAGSRGLAVCALPYQTFRRTTRVPRRLTAYPTHLQSRDADRPARMRLFFPHPHVWALV